ncbi:MAG TPA: MmgE/PrpD family protein [Candidatus Dormibacteraeota bacterium]|nr:MmgE/PrpD family protein [Candidatus Dormibacteraeota bacterium]
MTVSEELAAWALGLRPESVPDEVGTRARDAILDTVGVILAGVGEPVTRMVGELVAEDGCRPVASQLGTALRTSPEQAALLNGVSGHALDFDDVSRSMEGHPSVVALPAALAVAEAVGASGAELLAAYVVGVEVMGKLGRALGARHYQAGWHATATVGAVGAAVAAGRLLGLDREGLGRAVAIAVSEAGGSRQNFGTMTKPFHAGHAARCGVHAARLAARGLTASRTALEGRYGYFALFAPGFGRPEALVASLGRPFELVDPGLSVKRYPCCFATHRALDAVLDLRREHDLEPDRVERVRVTVPVGGLAPLIYDRPRNGLEGKFSLHYVVSAALLDGEVGLDAFTDEKVRRPAIAALEERVEVDEDPAIAVAHNPMEEGEVRVRIVLRDGSVRAGVVRHPRGSPARRLTRAELVAKFRDCASGLLGPERVERALACLDRLDRLDRVDELTAALRPAVMAA